MTDYRVLHFSRKEMIAETAVFAGLDILAGWLFFNSFAACLLMAPLSAAWLRIRRKQKASERRKQLTEDFRDALNSMTVSLRAGRAVEQAFAEAASDLAGIRGEEAPLTQEFRHIVRQLRMSVPPEQLLSDLAARSGVEDIEDFAAVFSAARKAGGNMALMIRKAAGTIEGKMDVEQEIEAALASKKLEQRIMSVMPGGIILYMRISSPGFLDVLYGNPAGAAVMGAVLAAYIGAVLWGRRIVSIEV